MFVAALTGTMISCNKNNEDLEPETTAPVEPQIKGRIITALSTFEFGVAGSQVNATIGSSGGFRTYQIMGAAEGTPKVILGIFLTDVKNPGTYSNSKNAVLKVWLDGTNANTTNTFSSELEVSVTITKITDKVIEGSFLGKIINVEGTHIGYLRDGTFKAKVN
jgi:hypothetical protein